MRLRGGAKSTSAGVVIAVAGVALAVCVMELSVAVSHGFKDSIRRKVLGFDAAVSVLPPYNYNLAENEEDMVLTDSLAGVIADVFPEARAVEAMRRHAILKTDSDFIAVECLAYGAAHDWSFERGNLERGSLPLADESVVISATMARQLGIDTAARPYMYFFVDGKPKARRVEVTGVYNSNFGDYDRSVVYVPLEFLQGVAGDSLAVSSVSLEGVRYADVREIPDKAARLQEALVNAHLAGRVDAIYSVANITQKGAVYFSWLDLLDTNVVVIFILMACVAGFTLISSLFIIILDRIPTIGILRAIGASRGAVSRIFLLTAMKIVGLGMLTGNAVALGVIWLQKATGFLPLNPEMYYLDRVPFEISWLDVLWLNVATAVIAWLILILPARLAATIDPASTVRYE